MRQETNPKVAAGRFFNRMIAKTPLNCTELILWTALLCRPAKARFRSFVNLLCSDLNKLSRVQNVGGELISINAPSIQANCAPCSPRYWRGPMTEKNDLVVIVNLVPRNAIFAGSVGSQGPMFG